MKKTLVTSGLHLSILTLFSRILGLVREMTKAAFLGTTPLADAFGIAFLIPNLLRRLFAENSISVAFIPTFKEFLHKEKIDEQNAKKNTAEFIHASLTLISFLTAITVVIGIFITPLIIKIFTKTNDTALPDEMILLTRIMFPYLFFISIAALFQGILNTVGIFSPSGFTPILFNILIIGATWILSRFVANAARAMAIGVFFGGLVQALFQLPFVLKQKFSLRFCKLKTAFQNKGTQQVFKLIAPTILGMATYQLNDIVSTVLANRAGTGIVSSLQYSLRLQELILGIFAVSIGTVILPDLSSLAQKKDWLHFNEMFLKAVKIIALITIPITFFGIVFGENIIILVYKSRKFSDESVLLTLNAFIFHIAGLFFIALNRIIAPAFYAQKNTYSPTLAGIIGFGVNIVLAIILVHFLQGGGIALALSLSAIVNTVALIILMPKKENLTGFFFMKHIGGYCLKIVIYSIIAILPCVYFKNKLFGLFAPLHRFLGQGIPLTISVIVYGLIGILLLTLTKDSLLLSLRKRGKHE